MTSFTVTYTLTEAQAARLTSLTTLYNQRADTDHTPADLFQTMMLTGSGHTIDERLDQTSQLLRLEKT